MSDPSCRSVRDRSGIARLCQRGEKGKLKVEADQGLEMVSA
jgi:hypothetical protein